MVDQLTRVPFGEASAWQRLPSPFYTDSHRRFKMAVRQFMNEQVLPEARIHESTGTFSYSDSFPLILFYVSLFLSNTIIQLSSFCVSHQHMVGDYPSKEVFEKCGQFGLLAARIGPGPWLKGRSLPGGVKLEEFGESYEVE